VRKLLEITLGILTAFGGLVDVGNLVANPQAGARFGMSLAWVVLVGMLGVQLYAEMSGRVATVSGRAAFDLVRERLGARAAMVNLAAAVGLTMLTVTAEIGGIGLVVELFTGLNRLLWVAPVAFGLWLVIWQVKFSVMEKVFGLTGLAMVVVVVALVRLGPDWHGLLQGALRPTVPQGEGHPTYWYFAIAQLGSVMTPYQVFFFSSGAVEEGWTRADLLVNRANIYIGYTLGAGLALALMAGAAVAFANQGIDVAHLSQTALPTTLALGRLGLGLLLLGMLAAVSSAALEASLSAGYAVAQYFGWQWGKFVRPGQAARFHLVVLLAIVLASAILLTSVDPIKVTELSLVLSVAALPLTYLPILLVANDRDYLGDKVNSRFTNLLASAYLVLLLAVSVAAVPLLVVTKLGQ
jgi:manganese transport protein